jgi:hypothetical protein
MRAAILLMHTKLILHHTLLLLLLLPVGWHVSTALCWPTVSNTPDKCRNGCWQGRSVMQGCCLIHAVQRMRPLGIPLQGLQLSWHAAAALVP